jgi:hypothetical protein
MPSRKQKRRRQKLHRHEWEEVYVDEDGRELEPAEAEEIIGPVEKRSARPRPEPQTRGGRAVEPPSWRRTLRRGLLFFPLMLLTVYLLAGDGVSTAGKITQTVMLMAFFLPFSYFMDSIVWRSYQRRLAKDDAPKR